MPPLKMLNQSLVSWSFSVEIKPGAEFSVSQLLFLNTFCVIGKGFLCKFSLFHYQTADKETVPLSAITLVYPS
jgi:hypothetical protein